MDSDKYCYFWKVKNEDEEAPCESESRCDECAYWMSEKESEEMMDEQ